MILCFVISRNICYQNFNNTILKEYLDTDFKITNVLFQCGRFRDKCENGGGKMATVLKYKNNGGYNET